MTPRGLLRFMRITQLALTAAGVLLLLVGSTVVGVMAITVGVSALVISGTGWYREIYFAPPPARARASTTTRTHARRPRGFGITRPHQ